ncbi:lysylphosphatidylglycerol synthase transmembrane domain-containing protein [Blastococcus atacamensis]|uniref:lysylphosphatidylglycerol synthase transmembrane domain-containing protein n=1 Tax=Blastococcus atacamensis TaxID=2070508 RepID=UPI0012FFE78A|nr:YbhN family protein [Blastococcus atacamensis]
MTIAQPQPRRGAGLRRVASGPAVRLGLTIGVVVAVFAGVLPQIADYGLAWRLVRSLSGPEAVLVAVLGAVNLMSYAPLWMAAVPGLTWWRALMADQASTAISNTVPAGFAFGVGTTAAMYHSFGFTSAIITRAVALTGIWNNLVKSAMPAAALGGLVLVSDATAGLTVAAVLGSVVLFAAVAALLVTLTNRRAGAALAGTAERLATRIALRRGRTGPSEWVERTDRFRTDSLELLRHRWLNLTAAAIASHAALFCLLLACLRTVDGEGADVHWIVVLAVFSVTRLVTIVPLTPGALGVAELSYVAGLTAVGVASTGAAGAVLLFRLLTWFLPIPLGLGAWLLWRRGAGRVPSRPEQRRTLA